MILLYAVLSNLSYLCMYICLYVCIYVCMYVCIDARMCVLGILTYVVYLRRHHNPLPHYWVTETKSMLFVGVPTAHC